MRGQTIGGYEFRIVFAVSDPENFPSHLYSIFTSEARSGAGVAGFLAPPPGSFPGRAEAARETRHVISDIRYIIGIILEIRNIRVVLRRGIFAHSRVHFNLI